MRGKYLLVLFSVIILNIQLFAQNKFEYDYARFYSGVDTVGFFELYYSFYQPAMNMVVIDGEESTQGKLNVLISSSENGDEIVNKSWQFDRRISDEKNQSLTGLLRFKLEFGSYDIKLTAEDLNNAAFSEEFEFQIDLPPKSETNITVSDIQLASGIQQGSEDTESLFYKNTLEVTPNPSLIYGDSNPVLFFYSEIYGLDKVNFRNFIVEEKLFDFNSEVQYKSPRRISDPASSIVEIGAIRVNNLNSGVYTLAVSVSDTNKNNVVSSVKKVYIYNKEFIDTTTSFANVKTGFESELALMSEEELNYIYNTSEYIATQLEKEQWDKLNDVEAKRSFLARFWNRRDPDTSTPINEGKIEYYKRVDYANDHYGNVSRRKGWKTDRGRVYITYGQPGEIERFQNEYYSEPYEIWNYYNLEGGVIFLFADEEGLNIYRLVHSTKKGEINNFREYRKYVQ